MKDLMPLLMFLVLLTVLIISGQSTLNAQGKENKVTPGAPASLKQEQYIRPGSAQRSDTVNKYIGETEKNLPRLFERAEPGGPIQYYHEADELFDSRSKTDDENDE